jgi:predicted kinase
VTAAAISKTATGTIRRAEAVIVLVGAPASGKSTLRRALQADGMVPERVLSLDDERAALRDRDADAGREARDLQDYSLPALRRCEEAATRLLADGRGYLADATHLRRRERVAHVRAAHAAGLPAVAMLLPALPVEVLAERNAVRAPDCRVPDDILARHAHRRSLLTAELLREEGFDDVIEVMQENALAAGVAAERG